MTPITLSMCSYPHVLVVALDLQSSNSLVHWKAAKHKIIDLTTTSCQCTDKNNINTYHYVYIKNIHLIRDLAMFSTVSQYMHLTQHNLVKPEQWSVSPL